MNNRYADVCTYVFGNYGFVKVLNFAKICELLEFDFVD